MEADCRFHPGRRIVTTRLPVSAGSWFRYAGFFQRSWQRDFFDVGNAGAIFMEMIKDRTLLPGMRQRMKRAMYG